MSKFPFIYFFEIIFASATFAAAYFAFKSSSAAELSAKSSFDSVKEAKLLRELSESPILIIKKDFNTIKFDWPCDLDARIQDFFSSRYGYMDSFTSGVNLYISNLGSAPALEVNIIFELHDNNGPIFVPRDFGEFGIYSGEVDLGNGKKSHEIYFEVNNNAISVELSQKEEIYISHLEQNERVQIKVPEKIMAHLIARGLNIWPNYSDAYLLNTIILIVRISAVSVNNTHYENHFRFKVDPFLGMDLNRSSSYSEWRSLPKI